MRHGMMRRSLAAASAAAMASAALVVGGAGVASAAPLTVSGKTKSILGNYMSYERTVSNTTPTHGDVVTISAKIERHGLANSATLTSMRNLHPACFKYVGGSASWVASGKPYSEATKPSEVNPQSEYLELDPPGLWETTPFTMQAKFEVLCDAGSYNSGGLTWNSALAGQGSDSASASIGPSITVQRASVSEFFLAAPVALEAGKATTLTVNTTAVDGTGVTFNVDGETLTATVSGGTASAPWTPKSAGDKTITAELAQTATHHGKSTQRTVTVAEQTVDSTVVIDAPATAQVGVPSELSATVSPPGAGGTVTFKEHGQRIGGATVPENGKVTIEWIPGTEGARTIDVEFSGRPGVNPSTAIGKTVQVAPMAPEMQASTTTVSPVAMTELGGTVELKATVAPAAGGTVKFYDGATLIGTVDVDENGVATYNWTPTTEGERVVRAVYSGGGTVLPSAGTTTAVISASSDTPEPGDPTEPGAPGDNSGSLGSLTGSLGGGNASGSLSSLGS